MAVWASTVASKNQKTYTAVAVFNMGEAEGTATVSLADLTSEHLDGGGGGGGHTSTTTTNVWTGARVAGSWPLKVTVVPHGSVLYTVENDDDDRDGDGESMVNVRLN